MNISGHYIAQSRPFKLGRRIPMKRSLIALAAFLSLLAAGLFLSSVVRAAPPGLPQNVMAQAVSPTDSTIELTWDAPSGGGTVVRYWTNRREEIPSEVFRDPTGRAADLRSVRYKMLKRATMYEFQVTACSNMIAPAKAGSDCSEPVTVSAATDASPPSKPANLMAQAGEEVGEVGIDDSIIRLTWDASTDNGGKAITHYEIHRRTPGTPDRDWDPDDIGTVRIEMPFPDPLQYDYAGTASQPYEFRVTAHNADTTFANANYSLAVSILGRPGAPTNVIYTRTGSTSVSISWDPPNNTGGATLTGYQYEHLADNGNSWTVAGTTSDTSTEVSGLMLDTDYLFRVRAENADRNSDYSANARLEQDYDADGDGLIDIQTLAELNAVRWDPNGDGMADDSADEDAYAAAFPSPAPGMGCLDTDADTEPGPCAGYELAADLDFDTGDTGDRTDDDYHNGGAGWLPIGTYSSVFDGNGRAIANLHINRPSSESGVGLFSFLGGGSEVRDLGLTGVDVNGRSRVGGLAGISFGTINRSYAVGTVRGRLGNTGGLVGDQRGAIINSHALGAVHGNSQVGGLVGSNNVVGRGVTGSYAAGTVSGRTQVGGLIGRNNDTVSRSFAAGTVTGSSIHIGGLVGENGGISTGDTGNIIASYSMATVSGHSRVGGLVGANLNTGRIIASYAAGTVHGVAPDSVEIGGLYGVLNLASRDFSGELTASYHDRDLSGIADDHGRTTDELTGPTGYDGIYAAWNRDLDGDGENDDPWDFGADGQYPALRADWNDADTTATWQEFGYQTRSPLALTVIRDSDPQASVSWPDITEMDWTGPPQASYVLYRDGAALTGYDGQSLTHTDMGLTAGQHYVYQVALLLDGVEFRRSREVSTEAASLTARPSPLTERTLHGAKLTVDLARAEYVSELLPEHFELSPATAGLSIASVVRVSNTRAILTLAFGGDFRSDLELAVTVASAATIEGETLATDSVTVTPAPVPDRVTGVNATGGSASLDVTWDAADNADGYVVQWRLAGEAQYERSVSVPGGLTTRTTLGDLLHETAYDVQVYATSHFAGDGPASATVTATTLIFVEPPPPPPPADAIVWHTVPCPLSEANLDGATMTLALLDRSPLVWHPRPRPNHFTASGVPGVSVTGVARLSDTQVALVLAYDDTDFDEDATLLVRIDGQALYSGGPISAATTVQAVVEEPPQRQVTGVRVTPGPRRITVNWDAVPDAHGYKVQWQRQAHDWQTDRREVSGRQRTLQGLRPGTDYTVRVVAIRDKAPYGEPSEAVATATPDFRAAITATEPSPLTEYNLNEATLVVDLEGAEWALNLRGSRLTLDRRLIQPKGLPVWVEYVERVSASRVKVILGYRGGDLDKDANGNNPKLTLELHEDTNGWAGTEVTVTVMATNEAEGNAQRPVVTATGGDKEVSVHWDPVVGATGYNLEWIGPGDTFGDNFQDRRRVITPATRHIIRKGLESGTEYTVRVAPFIPRIGYGLWSDPKTATTKKPDTAQQEPDPAETAPNMRAGVTVNPTRVTLPEGWTGSYGLSLDAQPDGDVSITMTSNNPDVAPYPNPIIFTPDNWQTEQLVGVPAARDGDAADDTAVISHTVSGGGYDGVTVASVTVTVTDEDTAGITVSESSLHLTEGGAATYQVSLGAQPTADVSIFVASHNVSGNADVSAEPAELTFTPENWRSTQTVTVRAVHDDDTADGEAVITHALSTAAGSGYDGVTVPNVFITVTDDDENTPQPAQQEEEPAAEPGSVTVSAASLPIREGNPAATYTVVLDAEPTGNVVITVSSDNGGVTAQPSSLTFTPDNWQTAQAVSVSAGEDDDKADDTATISHSASGGNYDGVAVASVTVSVTDDDTDREVLRDFYNATGGQDWTDNTNWLSNLPLHEWHGVTTNGQGQVTHLSLRDNNLSGSLPAELGKLVHLEILSLDRNSISGSLPAELGNLSNLTRLAMNRNSLSGAIPTELGSLPNLSIIGLARNQLSGALPASLGNLSGLMRLSLHDNTGMSGRLPDGFGNMSGLTRLAVSRTGLSGELPQGLVNSAMQYLHFDDTSLCAPSNTEFQTWLDGVPDKNGPTCA